MSATVAPGGMCANCGEALRGVFCHACGQRAASPDVSLHEFFHEAFHEFAHVDGKIVRTLKLLLTKPGQLTIEFLGGRRAQYISPVRLYLTCSLLLFGLAAVAPPAKQPYFRITKVDNEAGLDAATVKRLRDEATIEANESIVHLFPRVMFVLMPAFGALTWVFYHRRRHHYAAHLYYSIHFHAFAFLALTVFIVMRAVPTLSSVALIPFIGVAIYHYKSLRTVFAGSRWSMVWKGTIVWVVYFVMVVASVLGLGIWSAHKLH